MNTEQTTMCRPCPVPGPEYKTFLTDCFLQNQSDGQAGELCILLLRPVYLANTLTDTAS